MSIRRFFAIVGAFAHCAILSVAAHGQEGITPIKIARILTPEIAAKQNLGTLCPSVAITPNGVAVVGDGDQMWAVGADGAVKVEGVRNASSFAFSPDGLLVVVSGSNLQYLDPFNKTLKLIYTLPAAGMRIVPEGKDRFLLYGPDGAKGFALFELLPGRKVVKVIDSPRPITGVVRNGEQLLIVTGGMLFAIYNNSMLLLAGESGGALRSVAIDPDSGRIFLSDGNRTFEFHEGKIIPLFSDLSGELRWQSGGLLIFNPKERFLVQVANLP